MYVTDRKNLEASLASYPWINYYEKNFCLRITSEEHYDERYYAGFVWKSLERQTRPKVELDNPLLLIELFIDKDKTTVTRLTYQNFETFESRKAHLRPVLHPTAMHPKMARALINILNPGRKEHVIDPFCGACGILTEAGLLGLRFEGYDIDKKILDDARKNMEYYDIRQEHYSLSVKDSTNIKGLKNIVTDLPYGKSSKKSHELVELYSRFLKNLSGRAVIVMPSFMPYKALLDTHLPKSLTITHIIDHYVHKSLTRKIIVIDNKVKKFSKKTSERIIVKIPIKRVTIKPSKKSKKVTKKKLTNIKIKVKKHAKHIASKKVDARKHTHKKVKTYKRSDKRKRS